VRSVFRFAGKGRQGFVRHDIALSRNGCKVNQQGVTLKDSD